LPRSNFDPPLADLMDRDGVKVVQLLPARPQRGDEVGRLQDRKVLCDGAASWRAVAEVGQGSAVFGVKPIQQRPPYASASA